MINLEEGTPVLKDKEEPKKGAREGQEQHTTNTQDPQNHTPTPGPL